LPPAPGLTYRSDALPAPLARPFPRKLALATTLAVVGPGLMVMLADTDAGSVVTAAQSGAAWGYSLLPLEVALVPVLYLVMELTVRLGIATGKGHASLIKECFGRKWAVFSVATLVVSTTGAMVTELAGLAGVGAMVGIPPGVVVVGAVCFLGTVVLSGSYRRVERIGLALGLFELAFLVAALRAHPALHSIAGSFGSVGPLAQPGYLAIVAANVGAVIMPWMIFYQQSAVVDKGLQVKQLKLARADTAIGAAVTQLVMIAVLVAAAVALGDGGRHRSGTYGTGALRDVQTISAALVPSLGVTAGRLAFALGMAGAALVAALVVSLAAAWAFAEASGQRGSLNNRARQAPMFYGAYFVSLAVAAIVTLSWGDAVQLTIVVEVGNSVLLPIVLGFLLLLAKKALPAPYRLSRARSALLVGVVAAVLALNLVIGAQAVGL